MADPTREAAFTLLAAVLDEHRPLEQALNELPPLHQRDRAAAHRLAATVLRRTGTLDAVLEPFLRRSPPAAVQHILRMGAAGLLFLGLPPHAAVATSVALARTRSLVPFAGLVNAVLRRVAAAGQAGLTELDTQRLDTPAWLWAACGRDARLIATMHQQEPPLDVTLRPGAAPPPRGALLPTGSVRFPAGTRVSDIAGYAEGAFWVQDAAAALPARLLAPQPGETVADLCAAPGGKTAQLAVSGAQLVALDRDRLRLARLRQNLARLRLRAEVIEADAITWRPANEFDAVLLDAPCSATGTIRRHPDILHLKRLRDLPGLIQVQDRLLEAAARLLRPGARLIYAVCSLLPNEGPARVGAATRRTGLRHDPFQPGELAAFPEAITPEGYLRTHPGLWAEHGGMDGFFAARFVRC